MDHNGSMFSMFLGIFVVVYKQLRITPTLLLQPLFFGGRFMEIHGHMYRVFVRAIYGCLWV